MAGNNLSLQDALLSVSAFLPAGGSTSATSLFDLGTGPYGQFDPERVEFALNTPQLSTTQLPNSTYIQYELYTTAVATTNTASAVPLGQVTVSSTVGSLVGPYLQNWASPLSGTQANTIFFRPPIGGVNRYLFATATAPTSTLATTATFSIVAVA